jgi:hypothetical protein
MRVAAYVDGFNLYHGLKAKHGRRLFVARLEALVTSLLQARTAIGDAEVLHRQRP